MKECCRGCVYRTKKYACGYDMCQYVLVHNEPRGCEPEECKEKGIYKSGKGYRREISGKIKYMEEI